MGGPNVVFIAERRMHSRYQVPIVIEAPKLMSEPLLAEEISAGGFRVTLPEEPLSEAEYVASFWVGDAAFEHHHLVLAWSERNETRPPTWTAGFLVQMRESERKRLSRKIDQIASVPILE